jgi:hypothetical protein
VEVLATGFHDLQALAWAPAGGLYVTDRHGGTLFQVTPAAGGGARVTVQTADLRQPQGLAVGPDGACYVVEAGAGRVVRVDPAGPVPVWDGLLRPGWLAIGSDGSLTVTAWGRRGARRVMLLDLPPDAVEVLRRSPDGTVLELADHLVAPGGLWGEPTGTLLVSVERFRHQGERASPSLLRLDPAAPADHRLTPLAGPGLHQPVGPVVDGLGRWLLGARRQLTPHPVHEASGWRGDGLLLLGGAGGEPTLLGAGFGELRALVLAPEGHLLVATDDTILRLRAPDPPGVAPSGRYTNQPTLALTGTAEPGTQLVVLGGTAPVRTLAHPETGAFTVLVPLTPNAENRLAVHAVGAAGHGLASAATPVAVTHDAVAPETAITAGPPPALSGTAATLAFSGSDNLTPAAALQFTWRLDGGAWTAPSPLGAASLTGLTAGPHTFEVAARDQAGNSDPTPTVWQFTVQTLQVTVTTPVLGATVAAGPLLVRGTVDSGGPEVGVTVNGVPAAVQGGVWAAAVALPAGPGELTAVATTASGATASATVTIQVDAGTAAAGLELRAFPPGGTAPLSVTFSMRNTTGRALVFYELDADGDGTAERSSGTFEGLEATYATEGLYTACLRATDEQGQVYVATTLVSVMSHAQVNARLQATYGGMKEALRRGDVPAALPFIHSGVRDKYEGVFRSIAPEKLAEIDRYLAEAVPVEIGHNGAEYEIRRMRNGELLGFPLWFRRDADGIWRLWMF